jgi:cell division protein FtsB
MENKFKKFLSSRPFLFILLLAFIWLSIVLVKAVYKKNELNREIDNLKTEIEKLDKSGQEMNQLLDYFSSQSFLEKEAKEKLNLKKEGESVVMVPETVMIQEPGGAQATSTSGREAENDNNFMKWWNYFFRSAK